MKRYQVWFSDKNSSACVTITVEASSEKAAENKAIKELKEVVKDENSYRLEEVNKV